MGQKSLRKEVTFLLKLVKSEQIANQDVWEGYSTKGLTPAMPRMVTHTGREGK